MLCQVGSFGLQAEAQLTKHTHGHEVTAAGHEQQHHAAASQDHGTDHGHPGGSSHDHAGTADKCNFCSAFCSVTGLVSAGVTVAAPQTVSTVFPHLYAPPPSFVSDGQERPPRTI